VLLFLTSGQLELFMTSHTNSCSDLVWNSVRPRSWCWNIHFETKKQLQKRKDWSFVHFSMRWNWIILMSADCCWSQ